MIFDAKVGILMFKPLMKSHNNRLVFEE